MTVTDMKNSLFKFKRPLALFVAVVVLLCHCYLLISQTHTATVYIKFIGEKAEEGQAADGSVLMPYEITDPYVVGEALKQLGINDVKASTIAQKITVTPMISSAEEEKYASWIEQFSSYDETEDVYNVNLAGEFDGNEYVVENGIIKLAATKGQARVASITIELQ